jgi:hypothetical protein
MDEERPENDQPEPEPAPAPEPEPADDPSQGLPLADEIKTC